MNVRCACCWSVCSFINNLVRQHRYFIALYGVTFLLVLPAVLISNSRSPYFKLNIYSKNGPKLNDYKRMNDDRINFLTAGLDTLPTYNSNADHWHQNKTRLAITVLTAARDMKNQEQYSPHYLTQVVSKLLTLYEDFHSDVLQVRFLMCDVEQTAHTEAEHLSKYIRDVHHHDGYKDSPSSYEIGKRNYAYCLNASRSLNPGYILLVEDDALPHDNLFEHLEYLITIRLKQLRQPLFAYIKLYHPDWLNGYITGDPARLCELLSIPIILTAIVILFRFISFRSVQLPVTSLFLFYLYFIVCILLIGRMNVNYFRTMSFYLTALVPAPSCCTPANLYSIESAEKMVNYLAKIECKKGFAYDSAMDKFYKHSGLKSWFYEPKLFDHIGVFSTRHSTVILDPIKME